jgi:hypothetical protein
MALALQHTRKMQNVKRKTMQAEQGPETRKTKNLKTETLLCQQKHR